MADDCLFCRMGSGAMAVPRVCENDRAFAIRDINPRAPKHVLIIPRDHIDDVRSMDESHGPVLGAMFALANEAAAIEGLRDRGFRLAFNVGDDAGMTVHHLHLHVVGGRKLGPEG
jgi:histidine triad (HIT) family protein